MARPTSTPGLPVGSILGMADTQQAEDNGGTGTDGTADGSAPGGGLLSPERWRAVRDARRVARLAREIRAFAAAHGGAQGQIAHLGRAGARIVLVGEDGWWGDLVAPCPALARQAAERAGLTLHDTFDGALAERVRTGPYEWSRMAGNQLGAWHRK